MSERKHKKEFVVDLIYNTFHKLDSSGIKMFIKELGFSEDVCRVSTMPHLVKSLRKLKSLQNKENLFVLALSACWYYKNIGAQYAPERELLKEIRDAALSNFLSSVENDLKEISSEWKLDNFMDSAKIKKLFS